MTGTGLHRRVIGGAAVVVVVVVVACAVWLIRRGDDADHGSDATPVERLDAVIDLAELVGAADGSADVLGAALGDIGAALATPQDVDTFTAEHGRGPRDLANRLGVTLAALAAEVSPPAACGDRVDDLVRADTAWALGVASAAARGWSTTADPGTGDPGTGDDTTNDDPTPSDVTTGDPGTGDVTTGVDPTAVDRSADDAVGSIVPRGLDGEDRAAVIAALGDGDAETAAALVATGLGDQAARLVVGEMIVELSELLAADTGADYVTDFRVGAEVGGAPTSITDGCS